jgi:hypothetical protein
MARHECRIINYTAEALEAKIKARETQDQEKELLTDTGAIG